MVTKLKPKKNEIIFISKNSMLHILEGTGGIEIDFSVYHDWQDKLIFLEKGQYIKFLSGDFAIKQISFDDDALFNHSEFRVLFKHLVSLGYIRFDECIDCQKYLNTSVLNHPEKILDISTEQWFWQNPFHADTKEYHLIFDVKEVVDQQFKNHIGTNEIIDLLKGHDLDPQKLYTEKVGVTIKGLLTKKMLSESRKEVAFTNKSIKEIAYELGFKDPAYFNRFFKNQLGHTPGTLRETLDVNPKNQFIDDIYELIYNFHEEHRNIGFYADKMNMSIKSLSRKVSDKLNITLGQLIRLELIKSAKKYLEEGRSIKEVSRLLHFEEPNHFSSFFKHYTGHNPSTFTLEKVQ